MTVDAGEVTCGVFFRGINTVAPLLEDGSALELPLVLLCGVVCPCVGVVVAVVVVVVVVAVVVVVLDAGTDPRGTNRCAVTPSGNRMGAPNAPFRNEVGTGVALAGMRKLNADAGWGAGTVGDGETSLSSRTPILGAGFCCGATAVGGTTTGAAAFGAPDDELGAGVSVSSCVASTCSSRASLWAEGFDRRATFSPSCAVEKSRGLNSTDSNIRTWKGSSEGNESASADSFTNLGVLARVSGAGAAGFSLCCACVAADRGGGGACC